MNGDVAADDDDDDDGGDVEKDRKGRNGLLRTIFLGRLVQS